MVNWPHEYITSVHGSYGGGRVTSLTFKTSHERTSRTYGECGAADKQFTIMGRGGSRLLGLRGRQGTMLLSLGGYFYAGLPKQLELSGGHDGNAWDDGAYDGVTRVLVSNNANPWPHQTKTRDRGKLYN